MAETHEDTLSGDVPVPPSQFSDSERPLVSHEVIASYVADAALSVSGIAALHCSHWKKLSSRVRETRTGGIVVRDAGPGSIDVEVHARVTWGSFIPELARKVEAAVSERMAGLLGIELEAVTLFVDEIATPADDHGAGEH